MITGPFLAVDYICQIKICLLWPFRGLLISNLSYIIDIKKGAGGCDLMLVSHQNPYPFSSSLTKFLPTFPPLFFRPLILTRCLYCKSCCPFTFLFKLIGQKCQLKRWRVKREKTKSYSVINKHSLNLDEIFNLSRKGTRAKIRWS